MKTRRCFWYQDSGLPRVRANGQVGCPRPHNCDFIHPDDPMWASAKSSRPPASQHLAKGTGDDRPPAHSAHSERPSDAYYSSRRDREASTHSHPRSPVASASAEAPTLSRMASGSSSRSKLDAAVSSSRPPQEAKDAYRALSSKAHPLSLPPRPPSVKSGTTPNATPSHPTLSDRRSVKELSPGEKRTAWVERIKHLSEAVIFRSEHAKLQAEAQMYRRLAQSWRFGATSEEDKARLNAQLSDIQLQCETKRQELNTSVTKLIELDFWPLPQHGSPPIDASQKQIQVTVSELRGHITELYSLIDQTQTQSPAAVELKSALSMDVHDAQAEEHRPAKRQRLSPGHQEHLLDGVDVQDELRERLLMMERRLSDLENEMVQHDNDLLFEVEDLVQTRLEGLRSMSGKISTIKDGNGDHHSGLNPFSYEHQLHLEQELEITGGQVGELAQEVASLIRRANIGDKENAQLRDENEQLKEQLHALKTQQLQDREAIQANQLEIKALSEAARTCLACSLEKSLPSQVPSIEEVVSTIHPILLQTLQQDLQSNFQGMHATIENLLNEQNGHVYSTVLPKMSKTIKAVEILTTWMDCAQKENKMQDTL
ncbi:hypothetical protein AcW1_005847 [Taiwanofungus camphoratus]|nr:hypothetical protein AcW1_005847 [Antrodia cinnamomea]